MHAELTQTFEATKPQLRAFVLRLTASQEDTEDIVQETYLKAHKAFRSFRGDASLKTWLFSIASNLAKNHLTAKKRWPENVTDLGRAAAMRDPQFMNEWMQIYASSPQGAFEFKDQIAFCFSCVSKSLPLAHQVTLLLKEVYSFKIKEIAMIIDDTEAMVKYYLHAARTKMATIFDSRCSLINKKGACHQCSELNGLFNPKQKDQEERMKLEMVRASQSADKQYLLDLRMKLVQEVDPFEAPSAAIQLHQLAHNKRVVERAEE